MLQSLSHKSSQDSPPRELSLVIGPTEVADVMIAKVVTLSTHHGFDDAVRLMKDRHFRHCIVVDMQGKLCGVISDRDILRTMARNGQSRLKSLDQIMTRNPITVQRHTSILDAVSKIVSKKINCLPVVEDDGSVCGIVTSMSAI